MTDFFIAQAPSNIALIKYWGKQPNSLQWPANNSLSMTLNNLQTCSRVSLSSHSDHSLRMNQTPYSRADKTFAKAFRHLDRLALTYNFKTALDIDTSNSFPMGAGIASSASGLAALTIGALAAWTHSKSWADLERAGFSQHRLADLARLGSGSACRSLFGGFVSWIAGDHPDHQEYRPIYPAEHWPLRNTIVLFDDKQKTTSSSAAHELAWSSPWYKLRLSGLPERIQQVQDAISKRNIEALGSCLEVEALEMHVVISTTRSPTFYINSAAFEFLEAFRQARQKNEFQAWFTIDAGPNIHLIHEEAQHERLKTWLQSKFSKQKLLHDSIGQGPQLDFQSE